MRRLQGIEFMADKTGLDDNINGDRVLRNAAEDQICESPNASPELKEPMNGR